MNNEVLEESIARQAKRILHDESLTPCLEDLLYRKHPRLVGVEPGDDICDEQRDFNQVIKMMDKSYLCVQGPPGTGKTYTSARAIVDLIKDGKRVGVCSNSHKAIENLLEEIGIAAIEAGLDIEGAKFKTDQSGVLPVFSNPYIKVYKSEKKILDHLDQLNVVGATAWFFARADVKDKFDYLFIDEAGQVCLANVVAMADATKNLVLVGDQLQLEQPVKGSHPGESGQSSLEYLLGESSTIGRDKGIFLSTSRRMHPNLCNLVSSAVYDGRLQADPRTADRKLFPPSDKSIHLEKTSGLLYVPVEHEGNSQSSIEEANTIERLIYTLLDYQIQIDGVLRAIRMEDILIVAPYNRQVRLLKSRLPKATVGSVDKFQGREAAIVIVSMSSSDLGCSTRGAEFLLSKKRLNVAISRAQILAIVVGCPALSQFSCSTVEQASLLNFYCRFMQEGSVIEAELEACTSPVS